MHGLYVKKCPRSAWGGQSKSTSPQFIVAENKGAGATLEAHLRGSLGLRVIPLAGDEARSVLERNILHLTQLLAKTRHRTRSGGCARRGALRKGPREAGNQLASSRHVQSGAVCTISQR